MLGVAGRDVAALALELWRFVDMHVAAGPFVERKDGTTARLAVIPSPADADQASQRGGELICRVAGDRIVLEGSCVFYLQGEVEI